MAARPSVPGLVLALVFYAVSLTPSLLPLPWLLQALVSGVSAAAGYGVGALFGWAIGRLLRRPVPLTRSWWLGFVGLALVVDRRPRSSSASRGRTSYAVR